MILRVVCQRACPASVSPYQLLDAQDQSIDWANQFLDAQRLRQLSLRSLRAYAYDLLHFTRWWLSQNPPRPLSEINQSVLLDYVRHQLDQQPKPAPQTVNHRLTVIRNLYRFHHGCALPAGQCHMQHTYKVRSPLGSGRSHQRVAVGLRLRQPRRVVVPLSVEEVATFWR